MRGTATARPENENRPHLIGPQIFARACLTSSLTTLIVSRSSHIRFHGRVPSMSLVPLSLGTQLIATSRTGCLTSRATTMVPRQQATSTDIDHRLHQPN